MNSFKDVLLYLRKREGLTQRELADKLHVSKSVIGMYEMGQRYPTRDVEEAIADFFNVSIMTLRGQQIENDFSISSEEQHLIECFREAPKAEKDVVKRILSYYEKFSKNMEDKDESSQNNN